MVAPGISEILQVGAGSWVRSIGITLPIDDGRTLYGVFGAWLVLPFIWVVFWVEWIVERAVMNVKGENHWNLLDTLKYGVFFVISGIWKRRPWGEERQPLLYSDDD